MKNWESLRKSGILNKKIVKMSKIITNRNIYFFYLEKKAIKLL
jgi:hypothetical protein